MKKFRVTNTTIYGKRESRDEFFKELIEADSSEEAIEKRINDIIDFLDWDTVQSGGYLERNGEEIEVYTETGRTEALYTDFRATEEEAE